MIILSNHEVAPSGAEEPGVPVPLRLLQESRAVAALFRHRLPGPRPPLRQGRGSGHKMGAAPDVSDPHWEGTGSFPGKSEGRGVIIGAYLETTRAPLPQIPLELALYRHFAGE